jgi:hypothetical protein
MNIGIGLSACLGSVNYFVQKAAYDNQAKDNEDQQKVFLDLHRELPS